MFFVFFFSTGAEQPQLQLKSMIAAGAQRLQKSATRNSSREKAINIKHLILPYMWNQLTGIAQSDQLGTSKHSNLHVLF